jgi:arylsulfatase
MPRREAGSKSTGPRDEDPGWASLARVHGAARLATMLLCGALACSAPDPVDPSGYNLILINIDTLRADHLGAYLDQVASEGVLFEWALSNSSFTRESVSTLLTGLLPTQGGSVGWGAVPHPDASTLAEILRGAGYRTGFFSNTTALTHQNFTRGFEQHQHLPDEWGLSGMGEKLSERATKFMRAHTGERFFLYLHYLDPHGPYQPTNRMLRRLGQPRHPEPLHLYGSVRARCQELLANGFGPGDPQFEDLVLRYDAEISGTDRAIQSLFSQLERLDLDHRTLVVITADHGEEFLEHDFVEHAWTLYRESLHVPLIFWAPGILSPARSAGLVSLVDVMPTVLQLLEVDTGPRELDGRPLFGSENPEPVAPEDEGTVIAELLIRERSVLRAVVQGEWKYIAAYRWLAPEDRPAAAAEQDAARQANRGKPRVLWSTPVREELYWLARDPEERQDLSKERPEKLAELRRTLQRYRNRTERSGLLVEGGAEAAPALSPEERARLRALGYL